MSSLLPPNSTPLERAVATATAFELDTDGLRHAESAALCPPPLLPWLAWERSVDDWGDAWPVDVQRRAVASSVLLHKRKGTVWAVKQALAITGYRARIIEWFQQTPAGIPHTFMIDIDVEGQALTEASIASLMYRVDAAKPVRSHYSMRINNTVRSAIRHAAAIMSGETISIYPFQLTELNMPTCQAPRLGIGVQSWMTTEVRPR